jgi:molybdate transport system substrate-binding protein
VGDHRARHQRPGDLGADDEQRGVRGDLSPGRPGLPAGPGLRRAVLAVALSAALAVAAGCGSGADDSAADGAGSGLDGTITVHAAASLTDAFGEAADAFSRAHPGVDVDLNLAGSQALREQILAGAPGDVFASANMATMDEVVEAGAAAQPVVVAHNALEIAVPAGNPAGVDALDDLGDGDLLVGLCAVEVPCGDAARRAFDAAGVRPAPDTEEPDVRSLLTKVAAGELDAGLVYRSDVAAAGGDVEGVEVPDAVNVVTDYPAAVLADAGEPGIARAFVGFLRSSDGQEILESWGFDPA